MSFASVPVAMLCRAKALAARADYEALLAGEIFIAQAGNYTFATTSDDGSTLFIDGTQIVNNNSNHRRHDRHQQLPSL